MFKRLDLYLGKFKKISLAEETLKNIFISLVERHVGVRLQSAEVLIQNETLFVKSVKGVRSAVLSHRGALMRGLREQGGGTIADIR